MEPREIWAQRQRFKNLELLLGLSDWSLRGGTHSEGNRCLTIRCSEAIADRFKAKLDILRLYFERLEAIELNQEVVYENLRTDRNAMSREVKLRCVAIDPSKCVRLPLRSMKRD